jgi:hypothetical protein
MSNTKKPANRLAGFFHLIVCGVKEREFLTVKPGAACIRRLKPANGGF